MVERGPAEIGVTLMQAWQLPVAALLAHVPSGGANLHLWACAAAPWLGLLLLAVPRTADCPPAGCASLSPCR